MKWGCVSSETTKLNIGTENYSSNCSKCTVITQAQDLGYIKVPHQPYIASTKCKALNIEYWSKGQVVTKKVHEMNCTVREKNLSLPQRFFLENGCSIVEHHKFSVKSILNDAHAAAMKSMTKICNNKASLKFIKN